MVGRLNEVSAPAGITATTIGEGGGEKGTFLNASCMILSLKTLF